MANGNPRYQGQPLLRLLECYGCKTGTQLVIDVRPRNWVQMVNKPMTDKEIDRVRVSILRNRPLGSPAWQAKTALRLGLMHTLRSEGRPAKEPTRTTRN